MTTFSHLSRLISSLCCVLALTGIFSVTSASAKDQIVLCTIDDLSRDFSIMSTPKTYGYKLAVKEINDAGGIQVDGAKKTIKLVSYDGQSDIKRYQELAQRCVFNDEADVVMAGYTGAEREAAGPQQDDLLAQQPGRRRHRCGHCWCRRRRTLKSPSPRSSAPCSAQPP